MIICLFHGLILEKRKKTILSLPLSKMKSFKHDGKARPVYSILGSTKMKPICLDLCHISHGFRNMALNEHYDTILAKQCSKKLHKHFEMYVVKLRYPLCWRAKILSFLFNKDYINFKMFHYVRVITCLKKKAYKEWKVFHLDLKELNWYFRGYLKAILFGVSNETRKVT